MTDLGKNITKPLPHLNTNLIPGGSATNRDIFIHTDYDHDGNGKNNIKRFSLQSAQVFFLMRVSSIVTRYGRSYRFLKSFIP